VTLAAKTKGGGEVADVAHANHGGAARIAWTTASAVPMRSGLSAEVFELSQHIAARLEEDQLDDAIGLPRSATA
jgi:hypothetical protein